MIMQDFKDLAADFLFEVNPIYEDELILESFVKDIDIAREQIVKNEVYSEEEVYKKIY